MITKDAVTNSKEIKVYKDDNTCKALSIVYTSCFFKAAREGTA